MTTTSQPPPGSLALTALDQELGSHAVGKSSMGAIAADLGLSRSARASLARITLRFGTTLREFLATPSLHQEVAPYAPLPALALALRDYLYRRGAVRRTPESGGQTAPAALARSMQALLEGTKIPDVGSWPASLLDTASAYRLGLFASLGAMAINPERFLREENRAPTLALLQRFAAQVEEAREAGRRAPLVETLPPTGSDALDGFLRAVLIARGPLLDGWPKGVMQGSCALRVTGERVEVHVVIGESGPVSVVTLPPLEGWRGASPLACTCRRSACVHRALALDSLLRSAQEQKSKVRELLLHSLAPKWERALEDFLALDEQPAKGTKADRPGVLSFSLTPAEIDVRFHALGKKGPAKAFQRVTERGAYLRRVSGRDREVLEGLALAETESDLDSPLEGDAILRLVGHPAVYWLAGEEPLPVVLAQARAVAEESGDGYRFRVFAGETPLEPATDEGFPCSGGHLVVRHELRPEGGRLLLVTVPLRLFHFALSLAKNGDQFPKQALPRLAQVLPRLEEVAAVDLPEELRGEERPTQSRPAVRLDDAAGALRLSLRIEPIAQGPLFTPGQGVQLAVSLDGHKRVCARRDFEREVSEATAVAGQLGLDPAASAQPYTWTLPEGDRGVELLRRLHHAAEHGLWVEWKVKRPRFTAEAQLGNVSLQVSRKRDWFGLDGEVLVDGQRIKLAALLEAARQRRHWVRLGDGDFAQLSEQLVEKLAPLAHLAQGDATPRLGLGSAPMLEELSPLLAKVTADAGYRELLERLARAHQFEPALPEGLLASLRDYQLGGFRWMARLAEWGAGAVLADDMGLGKTLQALALLLLRAPLGPALVVGPASVLYGWRAEAARFAPSLRVRLFHEGDRSLDGLGPGDVVAVSWSLFAREAALFTGAHFATAILDEAQAIKNAGTQRAKAAHGLGAGFTVALSGTPIENHLGELWSLLRAVLPSLLGSEEAFKTRFGQGKESARALAAITRPFLLRRTKREVAQELPPRTDIDLLVPLSPEEKALYEDVRLSMAADLGTLTADDQRFRVLQALGRLRLAACHPRLVQPQWNGPASKLARLLELVRDLAAGGHKALVFSQFTSHLALVAEALRAEGLAYSYLDGQVPLAERQRRVEAFQAGTGGDLFLISLKAGGTGLTLTAADYVIHLDPWWNPAVEDQASDRAHRIGQSRPVTVYRLIAEGSVEQQILSLHREKRDLVDAFLAGADQAARLTTAQLAELIRAGE